MHQPAPRRPATALPLASVLLIALAGCSDRSGYPSLAPRPIERAADAAPAAAPTPPALPADAARDARAAALTEQAVQADAAFARSAEGACRMITAGLAASEGSEAWIAAQQALSALDAARGPVRSAAAELDQLLIDSSGDAGPPIDTSRLAAAAAQVSAFDTAEQARVEALRGGRCG